MYDDNDEKDEDVLLRPYTSLSPATESAEFFYVWWTQNSRVLVHGDW